MKHSNNKIMAHNRRIWIWIALQSAAFHLYAKDGVPFFKNFSSAEYGAHNRNFDVITGNNGRVYFANFEGLLCFDRNKWKIIHTPGYSRITRLFKDNSGKIWAGGYNFFGNLHEDSLGQTLLQAIVSDTMNNIGEVTDIWLEKKNIYFRNHKGTVFSVSQNKNCQIQQQNKKTVSSIPTHINRSINLAKNYSVYATLDRGLVVTGPKGQQNILLDESNGLCSNSINAIAKDLDGTVWGATDNGIFCVSLPSAFRRYTANEGLKGEVVCLTIYQNKLYAGTLQGLFRCEGRKVIRIPGITLACWHLQTTSDGKTLYAATSEGVFMLQNKHLSQLTQNYTQTMLCKNDTLYLAESDCLRTAVRIKKRIHTLHCTAADKVHTLAYNHSGVITAHTLSGIIYQKTKDSPQFIPAGRETLNYRITYKSGSTMWTTDDEGKNISITDSGTTTKSDNKLSLLRKLRIRSIYAESDSVAWLGGDFGVIRVERYGTDNAFQHLPQIYIREIKVDGKLMPTKSESADILPAATREIVFGFSTDSWNPTEKTVYQVMLEGFDGHWSNWSSENEKSYSNLSFGTYRFKVRAKDAFGRVSPATEYHFTIARPWYFHESAIAGYVLLTGLLILGGIRLRLRKLMREKIRLEQVVEERTIQIREQKEEIERKSENLEKALSDLHKTQKDLLRQEKMATIGKLTRGLVDRIQNPLNYINNFSRISIGLADELSHNLQETQKDIEADLYTDSTEILEDIKSNLKKIGLHGDSTSRTLKAMEEILKEDQQYRELVELNGICRQAIQNLQKLYKQEIAQIGLSFQLHLPSRPISVLGNPTLLDKVLMNLISNSMYALTRKYKKTPFRPEITLSVFLNGEKAYVEIRDNGTGIPPNVLSRIFDPFFTTKTTGEASGIGLYISREVIIAHHGDIHVQSKEGEYTKFIFTLPITKNQENDSYRQPTERN